MSRDISIKLLVLSAISVIFTSLATAQLQDVAGSWSLFGNIGETALAAGQSIIWYEISTLPDLAFFVAIWVATAAITLKFVNLIWGVITQRINLGSGSKYSISHNDDGSGTLEKIVATALSFIGAQYIGMVIGPLLAGTMLLLGSMILGAVVLIFWWFLKAGRDSLGRSGSSSGGGGFSFDLSIGGEAKKADEEMSEGEKEEERADTEARDAEAKEKSGDEETADREARDAAEHLQQALKDFSEAEGDIKTILDKDLEQMTQTLNELKDNINTIEEEEKIIRKVGQFPGKLSSRIQAIRTKAADGDASAWDDISERDLMWLGYGDSGPTLLDLNKEAQEISELIRTLKKEVVHEREDEESEEKELAIEIKELMAAHKLIRRLEEDVELARHIDEDELEVLAQQIRDEKLHEMVGYEEEEEEKLLNDLQNLVAEEEKIEQYLETADDILGKIMQIDREEIQEIRAEEGNLSDALTQLGNLEMQIEDMVGSADMTIDVPSGPTLNLQGFLDGFEGQIRAIEEDLDEVLDLKAANEEEIEKIRSYVENAIKSVS